MDSHVSESSLIDYSDVFKLPKQLNLTNNVKQYQLNKYFLTYLDGADIQYEITCK